MEDTKNVESPVDVRPVERLVMLLERVAVALEAIAQHQPKVMRTCTEFPWGRVSCRCRERLRIAVEKTRRREFSGYRWPLSCEDLCKIGARHMLENACIIGWARKSAEEIDAVLAEMGFEEWLAT